MLRDFMGKVTEEGDKKESESMLRKNKINIKDCVDVVRKGDDKFRQRIIKTFAHSFQSLPIAANRFQVFRNISMGIPP